MTTENEMNKSRLYLYVFYIILVSIILLVTACANDDFANGSELRGSRMSLGVNVVQSQDAHDSRASMAPKPKTYQIKTAGKPLYVQVSSQAYIDRHTDRKSMGRGVSVTSDTFYDRFGLYYYQYDKTKTWESIVSGRNVAPTESNISVEKSAGWHTDKYWPGIDNKLTFLAYAPYDNDYKNGSTKYIQLASTVRGYPTLTYTVPAKVEDQQDLVVSAEPGTQDMDGDYNKVVGMKFYHTLAAINFKIGSKMAPGKITKIEVQGVRNKGTYNFGTKEWTSLSGTASYSISPDYVIGDQRSVVFTGVDDTKNDLMLLMPQTVPSGAKIVVTIADGVGFGNSHQMELPINGHEWLPGYTITYSFSTSQEDGDYIFSVSKINNVSTEAASTVSYKVSSYVQSYYGSQTPVGWTAQYAVDDDIAAENYSSDYGDVIIGGFPFALSSPSATTTSQVANVSQLEPPVSNPLTNSHTKALREKSELGTKSSPYDLSTLGGSQRQSTANCYVVSAPGWYRIPIVYGNAIKNGSNNTAVYGSSRTTFVNHLGRTITGPYLYNNSGVVPAEAIVTWQDAYKLIEPDSLSISSDRKYLYFKVNKDNICQGNALLSVRNSSKTILWSWHIWVTDEDLSSSTQLSITNRKGTEYKIMSVPLGFCDTDKRNYKNRKIGFHFVQDNSGNTADVAFTQSTTNYLEYGWTAPYYQFGRSVPIRISNGLANQTKTLFMADGIDYSIQNKLVTTAVAIQTPLTFYWGNNGDWNSTVFNNIWDVVNTTKTLYDRTDHAVVKSIYDPCPAGYRMPEPAIFTGFTTTGTVQSTVANFNVAGSFNKGWNFYSKPNKQGATIFFHALGAVDYQGNFINVLNNVWGDYLTSGPSNENTSVQVKYELSFQKDFVYPYGGGGYRRTASRNIRPVGE